MLNSWVSSLRQCILDAQALGEIDPRAEVGQVVFEIQAMLLAANFLFVMTNDPIRLTQARKGVENVLARWAVRAESKKKRSHAADVTTRRGFRTIYFVSAQDRVACFRRSSRNLHEDVSLRPAVIKIIKAYKLGN